MLEPFWHLCSGGQRLLTINYMFSRGVDKNMMATHNNKPKPKRYATKRHTHTRDID